MKRITSIFLACILGLTLGACSSKNRNTKALLISVLNSEKTFLTENGEAVLLNNYSIGSGKLDTVLFAEPIEYVFVDFDEDKIDEMVINISSDFGRYLVLHVNGLDVYGYEFGIRSLLNLKIDGSFMGSNGAASQRYCRLTFEDNKANVIDTAIKDSTGNRFELNGEECSIEQLNEYINDWDLKKPVEWIKYINSTDNPKNNSDESNSQNNLAKINLHNYVSVKFSGENSNGYGYVSFDKEKFLLDHIGDVSFDKENIQVYREIYGSIDKSAANTVLKYISVSLDKNYGLSNGDAVQIVWEIDTEIIESYFEMNYVCISEIFTVSGLKEDASSTSKPQESITSKPQESITSKPQEDAGIYKITYDANGGSVKNNTQTVTYGSYYTLETPTRKGYTFAGWYDGETQYHGGTWNTSKNVILKAKWDINHYQVALDSTIGGSVSGTGYYTYNSTVTVSAKSKLGYTWLGWYDTNDERISTDLSYSFAMGDADVRLNAKWKTSADISDFKFTSTETTCTITDVVDDSKSTYTLPQYVTSIGDWAFFMCDNLTKITIPKGVTSIGSQAFSGCGNLTSIVIPSSVTNIEQNALSCHKLTSITFQGKKTEWNAITFGENWNFMTPATKIVCSDGTVTLG